MNYRVRTGPTVLAVGESETTRLWLRRHLEGIGCRVVEATNGREAVRIAGSVSLDLILMDLNMPVLDGFAATLRIRESELTRRLPVVALTACDSPEFRAAARAVGCSEYLSKPVDFGQLAALLNRLASHAPVTEGAEVA